MTHNQTWPETVQTVLDLLPRMPMPALPGKPRPQESHRLRPRLLSTTTQLVTTGRHRIPRLAHHRP
jgi:hypothetical protein